MERRELEAQSSGKSTQRTWREEVEERPALEGMELREAREEGCEEERLEEDEGGTGTQAQHWPVQEEPPQVWLHWRTVNSGQSTETALQKFWEGSKRTVQMVFGRQIWAEEREEAVREEREVTEEDEEEAQSWGNSRQKILMLEELCEEARREEREVEVEERLEREEFSEEEADERDEVRERRDEEAEESEESAEEREERREEREEERLLCSERAELEKELPRELGKDEENEEERPEERELRADEKEEGRLEEREEAEETGRH